MLNILLKVGVKLFLEFLWIVEVVFIVFCCFFDVVFGGIFDLLFIKIVGDFVCELLLVLIGCNCKEKYFIIFFCNMVLKKLFYSEDYYINLNILSFMS